MSSMQFTPWDHMKHVFISYVQEDSDSILVLRDILKQNKIDVWLDKDKLKPGQRWKQELKKAIKSGTFFIACFSEKYSQKQKSYMNEELTVAVEEIRQRKSDSVWFIPVKLSHCDIPDIDIGGGETLTDLHWVDLSSNWEEGIKSILSNMGISISDITLTSTWVDDPAYAKVNNKVNSNKTDIIKLPIFEFKEFLRDIRERKEFDALRVEIYMPGHNNTIGWQHIKTEIAIKGMLDEPETQKRIIYLTDKSKYTPLSELPREEGMVYQTLITYKGHTIYPFI